MIHYIKSKIKSTSICGIFVNYYDLTIIESAVTCKKCLNQLDNEV